ncbi:PepSY domain-containing protein [Anoxybacteroides amylolyticum]|uniref:Peptidase propeptide and YPEB domain protein n=1 Tax=Anoxybacteroides amylolyticum TaxID=294699 RepID=A0A160F7Y0_9BACL|nr:PepSY domain-containing protein [Anoxybacillus amylolyticus]ANB62183.1 peptidase propeptide and YPEB domain protein [Anoxybacillus amylolyticus]
MNWRTFIAGATAGFAAACFVQSWRNNQLLSSEKALALAKKAFQHAGPISGSWIQTTKEMYEKDGIIYHVYKGGICRGEEQYEFTIDAYTGTVIEKSRL